MENGRKKIRICLISVVLAAVIIGCFYYFTNTGKAPEAEGTLIQGTKVERYGC